MSFTSASSRGAASLSIFKSYLFQSLHTTTQQISTSSTKASSVAARSFQALGSNNNHINNRVIRSHPSIRLEHHSSSAVPKRSAIKVNLTELPKNFKMEWPKITLFGDSITRRSFDVDNGCWGSMINFRVNSYFDVHARGFEGYNSKWGLELMPKLFPKSYLDKVEIFVIFFGHNDSLHPGVYPASLSLEDYETNMRGIVKYLADSGVELRKIILITPSWYHKESFEQWLRDSGFPLVGKELPESKKYSEIVQKIAKDNDIECLNFFDISAKYEPLKDLFCDGIHFSRLGAELLFDNLIPIIEKKIEVSFKKPLGDLVHAIPFDQRPELLPFLSKYKKAEA